MGTVSDKLIYLQGTKSAIKNAIEAKGVSVETGTPFREYATKIGEISGGGGISIPTEWTQEYYNSLYAESLAKYPTEYLNMPEPLSTEQVCYALIAVSDNESNFIAFTCSGDYTVDWGDGTVENFSAGVKAEHTYSYSNGSLNSDTVIKYGFKQTMLTITMQSGQTLTELNFDQYHSSIGSSTSYDITLPILGLSIAGNSLSSLSLGTGNYVAISLLKYFRLSQNSITNFNYLLDGATSLELIPYMYTNNGTSFDYCFRFCRMLSTIPEINTSNSLTFSNCFNLCTSLITIPLLDVSNATNFTSFFYNCYGLKFIPTLNLSQAQVLISCFYNCFSLKYIPLLNTSSVTNFSSMCYGCSVLTSIPEIDTSNGTDFTNTFYGCRLLESVPNFDYSSALNFAGIFGVNSRLRKISQFNANLATNVNTVFNNCSSLEEVFNVNFASATSITAPFNGCYNLRRLTGNIPFTFSIANGKFSATALNELFTSLPTVTGKSVTITGNYGAATCDTSIATAKGWTVVN